MKAHAAKSDPGLGGRGVMSRRGALAADEEVRFAEIEHLFGGAEDDAGALPRPRKSPKETADA